MVTKSSTNRMFFGATSIRSTFMLSQCRVGVALSSGLLNADFGTDATRERHVATLDPSPCLTKASASSLGVHKVSGLVSVLPGTGTSVASLEKKSGNRL